MISKKVTSLNTGMCSGELLGLKWDCVDFKNRLLIVKRTFIKEKNMIVDKTKGKKRRLIGINNTLYELLFSAYTQRNPQCDLVFNDKGKIIDRSNLRARHFDKEIKRAGVTPIRPHDLRHTFSSHFVMNGGSTYDLQQILGHSDIRTTEIYAHLSPDHIKEKMNLVSFGSQKIQKGAKILSFKK